MLQLADERDLVDNEEECPMTLDLIPTTPVDDGYDESCYRLVLNQDAGATCGRLGIRWQKAHAEIYVSSDILLTEGWMALTLISAALTEVFSRLTVAFIFCPDDEEELEWALGVLQAWPHGGRVGNGIFYCISAAEWFCPAEEDELAA